LKILLLCPVSPESFLGLNRVSYMMGNGYSTVTLSLPTLAAVTPSEHDVALIDENVEAIDFDTPCDVVGISCMSVQRARAFEIAAEFRRRGRIVAMGGGLPTLDPDSCRDHADVLFIGEAERTWPRFLRDYASGTWNDRYQEHERIDLRTQPAPRHGLLRMNRYFVHAVQFSRGCPHGCEFCNVASLLGSEFRTKTVTAFLAEIEHLRTLGARRILIVDDNFTVDMPKAKDVLRSIGAWGREHGHPMMFVLQASLNVADDEEMLQLLRDARVVRLFIGVETPNRESLAEAGKSINLRKPMIDRIRRIQSYSMQVVAGMIVGFDHDDASIFDEQVKFLEEAGIPQALCGILQAIENTPLYERLSREGRIQGTFSGDNVGTTNIVPKGMDERTLLEGYAGMMERLYSYGSYGRRVERYLLADRRIEPIMPARMTSEEKRTLLRFLRFALFSGDAERRRFSRRIVRRVLLRHPKRLAEALYLTVVHAHFHVYVRDLAETIRRAAGEETSVATPRRAAATLTFAEGRK